MRIPRVVQIILLMLLMAISAEAQETASKDLRHLSARAATPPDQAPENPKGCKTMGVGYADGATLLKRQIRLQLVTISDQNLILGNEIVATVKLQNGGDGSVEIPWSTDFRTTKDGQDASNRQWESGEFRIAVRYGKNQYCDLTNTSQLLYGSKFVPGSILTIRPGEWITAQISFRVQAEQPAYERIEEGPAELAVEWVQTARTYVVKDCGLTLGFFPYDGFYDHRNRVVVRRVEITPPNKAQESRP
jgi:hypothetical protein